MIDLSKMKPTELWAEIEPYIIPPTTIDTAAKRARRVIALRAELKKRLAVMDSCPMDWSNPLMEGLVGCWGPACKMKWAAAPHGMALDFDGASDYITLVWDRARCPDEVKSLFRPRSVVMKPELVVTNCITVSPDCPKCGKPKAALWKEGPCYRCVTVRPGAKSGYEYAEDWRKPVDGEDFLTWNGEHVVRQGTTGFANNHHDDGKRWIMVKVEEEWHIPDWAKDTPLGVIKKLVCRVKELENRIGDQG